jgi:hypothetical protein
MATKRTPFTVVAHIPIAINYMSTFQHRRLCIFTIKAGHSESVYLTDLDLDIANLTETKIKRHLLENLNRATLIHTCAEQGARA